MRRIFDIKLLPGLAAAAFLMSSPLHAQGGGTAPQPFAGPTMTLEQCRALPEDFWACPDEQGVLAGQQIDLNTRVGEQIPLREVPAAFAARTPAMQGQLYFALPDDRIAIVDREDRVVVDIIELE